jgi:polyhydroxyalkanoate synthesis repressor PhaR
MFFLIHDVNAAVQYDNKGFNMTNDSTAKNKKSDAKEPVIIKKYANRRLYNTETSTYITLEDVRELVKRGEDFLVHDAKSGEDLTRQILTQIIFEQELNGQSVMPIGFLKRVIELYDDKISEMVPHYLETSMEAFITNQEKVRSYMDKAWGAYTPITPMSPFGEIGKQNMEMMGKAFQMFNPFESFFTTADKAKQDDKN